MATVHDRHHPARSRKLSLGNNVDETYSELFRSSSFMEADYRSQLGEIKTGEVGAIRSRNLITILEFF